MAASGLNTTQMIPQLSRFTIALISILFVIAVGGLHALSLGFDFGTSGVRACLIDSGKTNAILHEGSLSWTDIPSVEADQRACATAWINALEQLITNIPSDMRCRVQHMCLSGTSASALLVRHGANGLYTVSRPPRMYDYNVVTQTSWGKDAMEIVKQFSPLDSAALAPTSTLPKLIAWNLETALAPNELLVHQADFILHHLCHDLSTEQPLPTQIPFCSDWNNALKLGYDVKSLEYPPWLLKLLAHSNINPTALPRVIEPGALIGSISVSLATRLGLSKHCVVKAGTTDSIAAFLASGAASSGQAVTSLGSTLAIKMLSDRPVEDSSRGIYSHRIGNQWLVGGASNVGCAVLRQQNFSNVELEKLSDQIDPNSDSPLEYYPLTKIGERFPENDPLKAPVLTPVPASRRDYLHGILYAISKIELKGT